MYIHRGSEAFLNEWRRRTHRKPLILRGARQTGKSRLVEEFGKNQYEDLVVVNLEKERRLHSLFDKDPAEIVRELEILKDTPIQEGKTLLFIDEIQACPPAISKLRYFFEDLPNQHVIAAGSLLEFVLEQEKLSFPVGRVDFHYLFPLTFEEFLCGGGHDRLVEALQQVEIRKSLSEPLHDQARRLLKEYLLVGGMPEADVRFFETGNYRETEFVKESILETYREDFKKFSKRVNVDNLDLIFHEAPKRVGQRINLSKLCGDIRARDAGVALKLLQKAMLLLRVNRAESVSFPLIPLKKTQPKLVFLDLGLVQYDNRISAEILESSNYNTIYKGGFVEQLVGQELIALLSSHRHPELFYWQRESKGATAEVDYLLPHRSLLLPVEVKAGRGSTLFSLHQFMAAHPSPLAIRIYDGPLQLDPLSVALPKVSYSLLSVPLYMVSCLPRLIEEYLE